MITVLLGIAVVFVSAYLILKPNIVDWNQRGFELFTDSWNRIFLVAGLIAEIAALLGWWQSNFNPLVGLILGLLAGFFAIAAWTDAHVRKVPLEISNLTVYVAFAFLVGTALTNANLPILNFTYLPVVAANDFWTVLGVSAVVMLAGVIGFIRVKGSLGWVALFIGFVGLFVFGYTAISGLRGLDDPYWQAVGVKLLTTFVFISIVMLFDVFFGHLIGGADMKAMYAAGFGLTWWVGFYSLIIFMLAGFVIQALLHIVGKPLGIGEMRTVKNGPIRQLWVKSRAKDKTNVPTTHEALALPFLPVLVISFVGGSLILLTLV